MKIVCISDTHNKIDQLVIPEGDVLIHAGDATMGGTVTEIEKFNHFLGTLPHRHKVFVAGNHDWLFEKKLKVAKRLLTNAIYLQDRLVEIEGVRIYGSPWQPWFHSWAFNVARGSLIKEKWDLIKPCDVLVTHGPPMGFGDHVPRGENVGCQDLLEAVERIKPKYHVFGHIHEGYGTYQNEHTTFVNPASCDGDYRLVNKPIVISI